MTINSAIDMYGESAHGSIEVQVVPDEHQIRLVGSRAGFTLLAYIVDGLLNEADCHFSLSPFGAGQSYFHGDGPGLYLHRQPCIPGNSIFPMGRGLAWLCFLDDVPAAERDHDPSFIVIEGYEDALKYLQMLFAAMAESKNVVCSADELAEAFGWGPGFSLHLIQSDRPTPDLVKGR